MFDLYALPEDFPGYAEARRLTDPLLRVEALEQAFSEDIGHPRFIPYIQLHEFEALLFADPSCLDWYFVDDDHALAIARLVKLAASFTSPEHIDDGASTAPSKRIIQELPAYEKAKRVAGPLVAAKIGLQVIRGKCAHFDAWLKKLEVLGVLTS